MKEFIKTVKQTFRASGEELLGFNLFSVIGGIVGVVIMLIVLAADKTINSYGTAGGVMAIVLGIMLILFGGVFSLQQDFNLAISMGKTRKYYVPARFLLVAANCLLCLVIACLVSWVEKVIYEELHPGIFCELYMNDFLLKPVVVLCFVLLVPAAVVLGGAFFTKFGVKFFWVFWVIWMVGFSALPKMIQAVKHNPNTLYGKAGTAIIRIFTEITEPQVIVAIVIIGILGVMGAFLLLRRQRVTL